MFKAKGGKNVGIKLKTVAFGDGTSREQLRSRDETLHLVVMTSQRVWDQTADVTHTFGA